MNSSKWIDERSHNDINQGGHNMVGARKSCRSKKLGLNVCLMLCGGLLLLGGGKTAWGDDYVCSHPDIWTSLMDRIPINEILPITIGGSTLGQGGKLPSDAVNTAVCACENALGIQEPGVSVGYWEPAYLIELVRNFGCSPVLGTKLNISVGDAQSLGGSGAGDFGSADLFFYQAHVFSFPLLRMLNLMNDLSCGEDDYFDLDLLYMSELDPTWSNELLSLKTTPELQSLARASIVESCAMDASMALEGDISDELTYCAGSWGFLYPLAGYGATSGVAQDTSLLAARVLTLLHRRGLMRHTSGSKAMCGSVYEKFPLKSGYWFSLLYPLAEHTSNHAFGAPVEYWQGDRRIPPGFSDVIYVVWRYKNCCLRLD